jgi:hypothetical protein
LSRGLGAKQRHVLEDAALALLNDEPLVSWSTSCGERDDPAVRRARGSLLRMGFIERSPGTAAAFRIACEMPPLPQYLKWKQLNRGALQGFPVTLQAILGRHGVALADEAGGRLLTRQRGHRAAWEPPLALYFAAWLVESGELARVHASRARLGVPASARFDAAALPTWCPASKNAPSL